MSSISDFDADDYVGYHAGPPRSIHIPTHPGIAIVTSPGDIDKVAESQIQAALGTLGALVTDNATKKRYMLSNSHVLLPKHIFSKAAIGSPIYPVFVETATSYSTGSVTIGKVFKDLTQTKQNYHIVNGIFLDAALAEPMIPITDYINYIGIPKGHRDPKAGEHFRTVGATSGLREGTITKADMGMVDPDPRVKSVANAKPTPGAFETSLTMLPGDSGSPVVSDDGNILGIMSRNYAVGRSVGVKASSIAKAYNVSFVGNGTAYRPPLFQEYYDRVTKAAAAIPDYAEVQAKVLGALKTLGVDITNYDASTGVGKVGEGASVSVARNAIPAPQRTGTTSVSTPVSKAPIEAKKTSIIAGVDNIVLLGGAGLLILLIALVKK